MQELKAELHLGILLASMIVFIASMWPYGKKND